MKQKTPDELKESIRFYRTITILLVCLVLFIGFNNVSTTNKCKKFEADLKVQKAKNQVLAEELQKTKSDIVMGTCLLISKL
jgi:high-affinity K+ transport system ATPase subunit B